MASGTQKARENLDRAQRIIEKREASIERLDEAADVLFDSLSEIEDLGEKLRRLLPDHPMRNRREIESLGENFYPLPPGQSMAGSSRRSRFATFLQSRFNSVCGSKNFGNIINGKILIALKLPEEFAKFEGPVHRETLAILQKKLDFERR